MKLVIGSPHSDDVRLRCQIFDKFQLETFIKNFQDQEVRWPTLHKNSPGSLKIVEKNTPGHLACEQVLRGALVAARAPRRACSQARTLNTQL